MAYAICVYWRPRGTRWVLLGYVRLINIVIQSWVYKNPWLSINLNVLFIFGLTHNVRHRSLLDIECLLLKGAFNLVLFFLKFSIEEVGKTRGRGSRAQSFVKLHFCLVFLRLVIILGCLAEQRRHFLKFMISLFSLELQGGVNGADRLMLLVQIISIKRTVAETGFLIVSNIGLNTIKCVPYVGPIAEVVEPSFPRCYPIKASVKVFQQTHGNLQLTLKKFLFGPGKLLAHLSLSS